MKRLLTLILIFALTLSLAACGKTTPPADTPEPAAPTGPETPSDEPLPADGDTPEYELPLSTWVTEDGFFKDVVASDHVTLPEYKGVEIPAEVLTAPEDQVNETLDELKSRFAETVRVTDRAVKDGDTVNIDYVGSIDGVEFAGGSTGGNGTDVTIGVTQYIDDFLEQLIGHTPGETINVEVTFPDPYPNNQDLANKDAVFVTTINYISETVERELTDELVHDELGYDSVAALVDLIKQDIIKEQKQDYAESILAKAECTSIPESVKKALNRTYIMAAEAQAAQYGVDLTTLLQYFFQMNSAEEYIEYMSHVIDEDAAAFLTAQAIAETEGLSVSVDRIAANGYESAVQRFGIEYVSLVLMRSEVVPDFIVDNAA